MSYVVFGESPMESILLKRLSQSFSEENTLIVRSDKDLTEALSSIKYRPFFGDSWLVNIHTDFIKEESVRLIIPHLVSGRVTIYLKIVKQKSLWPKFRKSKKLMETASLRMINLKYPDDAFLKEYIFESLIKFIDDKALSYLVNQLRHNLTQLDEAVADLNFCEFSYITEKVAKRIVKPDRKRRLYDLCDCVMFAKRDDLKERWRDHKVFAGANSKVKPYEIVRAADTSPEYILGTLSGTLQDLLLVKRLHRRGYLTINNVFDQKQVIEKKIESFKIIPIPVIRKYLFMSEVLSQRDITYCLNECLQLKAKGNLTVDDIHFLVYRLMNRR